MNTVQKFIDTLDKSTEWNISLETIQRLKEEERMNQSGPRELFPVVVSIAKLEHDYIEEFVKYHLALGFKRIYLYDNEDVPTYEKLLHKYKDHIKVTHFPFNNYHKGIQYIMLEHFVMNYLYKSEITHAINIDIDEYICLKKHNNICDFINEYIKDDCQGIAINWRFFGSSGLTEKSNEPLTQRFKKCEDYPKYPLVSPAIKTLYKKDNFLKYGYIHNIYLSSGCIKSTSGDIVPAYFNQTPDFSVIQLNHYKCKTLSEFKYVQTRKRPDVSMNIQTGQDDLDEIFKYNDRSETLDLAAYNFYKTNC